MASFKNVNMRKVHVLTFDQEAMRFLQITQPQRSKPGISNHIHLPPSRFLKVMVQEEALQRINIQCNHKLPNTTSIIQHKVPNSKQIQPNHCLFIYFEFPRLGLRENLIKCIIGLHYLMSICRQNIDTGRKHFSLRS